MQAFVFRLSSFVFRRPSSFVFGLFLVVAAILWLGVPALAADPPATVGLAHTDHYCIACHSANDPRLNAPLAWNGDPACDALSPCPTVRELRDELAYTDAAFDAIANGMRDLASHGISTTTLDARLLAREESFPRVVETSYRTVDAGVGAARSFRYQLNKTYTRVQSDRSAWTMNVMLIVGVIVTLFLLASLAWGWWNTRHLKVSIFRGFRLSVGAFLFVLVVFVIFALPIFNPPTQTEAATAADLTRQNALDAATRAAVSAENLSAQAWEISRLAASSSPASRPALIETAISSTRVLETNFDAYWGSARALEESAVTWDKASDAAPPLVQRIEVAASRAWAYAAMADELAVTNPVSATALLNTALARTQKNPDSYFRDLDLKKIAVAWSPLNRDRAIAAANQIADPFLRAWALREMGAFDQATASARLVSDAYQRAYALREIAVASKNPALLSEALTIAQTLPEPARAYALADLAAAWQPFDANQAAQVAHSIAPQFPDARASAFHHVGRFADAWTELAKLKPGFEQARAQSELVAAWARVSPNDALAAAPQIRDPFLRAEAQRAVVAVLASSDAARARDLANAIPIPFVRVQALTDVARVTRDAVTFEQAAALADDLHDPYPLRDLVIAWAPIEPTKALALVDKMDLEADRAQALLAVALALAPTDHAQANAVFDRAVWQAQAARVLGDPLYSAELMRELGARYAAIDAAKANEAFSAALDAARQVTTAF
jgi:uncharacterized membrane protein (DUF485 family)